MTKSIALRFVLTCALVMTSCGGGGSSGARGAVRTVEWVCGEHEERVRGLFDALDLERAGLAGVRGAVASKAWPRACRELLAYYRSSDSGKWLRQGAVLERVDTDPRAEKLLDDTFTFHSIEFKVPRSKSGGVDWETRGPNDDPQWTQSLNRHYHLPWLMHAYLKTGKDDYARLLGDHVVDWVLSNPYPGRFNRTPQWSGLPVAGRARHWAEVFYGLQATGALTDAAAILMLSSLPEHASYLRSFHRPTTNWLASEMDGLATIAVAWPEFRDAPEWLSYAVEQMTDGIDAQVYPDGTQKELTAQYQRVAAHDFERFVETLSHTGIAAPGAITEGIERMWRYLAYAVRPDGSSPMNNDADREYVREWLLSAADRYGRADWTYIATNGHRGQPPPEPPSVLFPWARQLVMRDAWREDAQWAFFDAGPAGIAHEHADKLHLSIAAYGRDLLVDAGRYTYAWGVDRNYFVGSAGHNVILVDGCRQELGAPEASEPMAADDYRIEAAFDFARGTMNAGFIGLEGRAAHTRSVLYVRGRLWVVVDRVETDRPRDIEVLWHFHPDCTLALEDGSVASVDADRGNLRVLPAPGVDWGVDVVAGEVSPVQGWYSDAYNHKVPSPTAVYRTRIDGPTTVAWVLQPGRGLVERAQVRVLDGGPETYRLRVSLADTTTLDVAVPVTGGAPSVERAPTR